MGLVAERQRTPIPGELQDVSSVLDKPVRETPEKEAVVGAHRRYTYKQLEESVRSCVAVLRDCGVKPGDRVAASMGNHPEIIIAFLAVQRLGAIWLGVNRAFAAPEKAHLLRDSEASLLICQPEIAEEMEPGRDGLPDLKRIILIDPADESTEFFRLLADNANAPDFREDVDPWAPAVIGYTSGTTGFPKGVVHSQHNMVLAATMRKRKGEVRHGVAIPFTIMNGMIVGPVYALAKGGTLFCLRRLYAPEIAEWVGREKIVSLNSAPAVIYDMIANPEIDTEQLKTLGAPVLGGGHISQAQREMYKSFFGTGLTYSYGLTEAPSAVVSSIPGEEPVPESAGLPLEHVAIKICDDEGSELPAGAIGEICVGPRSEGPMKDVYTPMLGYWKNPQATAQTLRGGWLRTGDLGEVNEDGVLFVRGRLKEMVIRGGANIYPAEVERVIYGHDSVLACAVSGRPDERLGEEVVGFIQFKPRVEDREGALEVIREDCMNRLSKHKVPADWVVVDEMPRNDMKKIVKPKLVEIYFSTKG